METSKAYFEDFLRRFETERRGRTLFQFCRDEGADYKSLMAYRRSTEPKGKGRKKTAEPQTDTDMEELDARVPHHSQDPRRLALTAHAAAPTFKQF